MTKEVLTLALEALKLSDTVFYPQTKIAIAAIERALANHIEDNLVMVQEPVAWYYPDGSPEQCTTDKAYAEMEPAWTPLYTTPSQRTEPVCPECKAGVLYECVACSSNNYPPQRTWVGLTYEDMTKLQKDLYDAKGEIVLPTTFAMAVEAKLKEKNT